MLGSCTNLGGSKDSSILSAALSNCATLKEAGMRNLAVYLNARWFL